MKKTIALLLALIMSIASFSAYLTIAAAAETEENVPAAAGDGEKALNVARGAQYITSDLFRQNDWYQWSADAPIAYPDIDGVELTDGVFPSGEDDYSDPAYFGFRADSPDYVGRGYAYIRVDLGQEYDLSALVLYVGTSNLSNGIYAPADVSFYAVDDMKGSNPVLLGTVCPEDDDTVPYVPCKLETEATARFIEMQIHAVNWLFVTEFEAYAPGLTLGDLDGNGVINGLDYMMLKRCVLKTVELTPAQKIVGDINKDGDLTAIDYMYLKRHVLGTISIG